MQYKVQPCLLWVAVFMLVQPIALADDGAAPAASPSIETRVVEYEKDGVKFHGYLAQPREREGDVPGVLVVHEWWGQNEFAQLQARRLAELGYIAFAADMYGEGRTTDDPQRAGQLAGQLYNDRDLLRSRVGAALDVLSEQPGVDAQRLGAIGYCFGGTVVVELGYSHSKAKAVVSFHGNPMPAREGDDEIKANMLILHGTADTLVPDDVLEAYSKAMKAREGIYRIIRYQDAKHSFTNPAADVLEMEGVGYDEQAARRSWADMRRFFNEVFNEQR
jgi:dienelactone hydrolase